VASGRYVGVMDADLQDEKFIPEESTPPVRGGEEESRSKRPRNKLARSVRVNSASCDGAALGAAGADVRSEHSH
jgi:hypothetical protein